VDDLRPGYREFAAPAAHRASIACLWVRVVGEQGAAPTRVLPDACVDLIWSAGRGAWVAGPDTGPVVVEARPHAVMVGARFRPGAGGAALGLPLSELRDLRAPAGELWPELDRQLPPDLKPRAAMARIAQVAASLVTAAPPDAAVAAATKLLADPAARVERLAGTLGFSERQLRRRCHAAAGYGPKTLARVLRFRRFVARADPDADLARLALECGYADQPHLTRECTRLAGLPPAAFMRDRAAARPARGSGAPPRR
jgi:AraC-like DNA-binding protein